MHAFRRAVTPLLLLLGNCASPDAGEAVRLNELPPPWQPTPAFPVEARLEVPATVIWRCPVPLRLTLRNVGPRPVEFFLLGEPGSIDFVVGPPDGAAVWHYQEDGGYTEVRGEDVTLRPGEARSWLHTWNQRSNRGAWIRPGVYQAVGAIPLNLGEIFTRSPPFQIKPGFCKRRQLDLRETRAPRSFSQPARALRSSAPPPETLW